MSDVTMDAHMLGVVSVAAVVWVIMEVEVVAVVLVGVRVVVVMEVIVVVVVMVGVIVVVGQGGCAPPHSPSRLKDMLTQTGCLEIW